MHRIYQTMCGLAVAIASLVVSPSARADEPQQQDQSANAQNAQSKRMLTKQSNVTATVDKVDQDKRMLTLRLDDGTTTTVHVPSSVQMPNIQQGDKIKVDYFEALAVRWKRSGAGGGGGENEISAKGADKLPSAMMAETEKESAEITKIDKANHKVTVKLSDGRMETIDVKDPQMQADLAKAKEGDHVDVTFTHGEAIKVEKGEKAQK
jgi:translation initiation factor IF-1